MPMFKSLGFKLPTHCLLCKIQPKSPQSSVCQACWNELPWLLQDFKQSDLSVQAVCHYQWPVDRVIHCYKYQQRLDLLPLLRDILLNVPTPKVQAIIAVPSSSKRLVERGFNPTLMLAKAMASHWNIPLWQPLNRHHAPAQQHLSRQERLSNLQNAFFVNPAQSRVIYRKVLILDDVLTTGSTLRAMQQPLFDIGVEQIENLVLAHA